MKKRFAWLMVSMSLFSSAPAAAQEQGAGTPERGEGQPIRFDRERTQLGREIAKGGAQAGGVGMKCMACHGLEGGGRDEVPRLAGLPFDYLAGQIEAYVSGERQSAIMGPIAEQLMPKEATAVLSYYSILPAPDIQPPLDLNWELAEAGQLLAYAGRQGLEGPEVTACVMCHNPVGELGEAQIAPPLSGQPAPYLESQLQAWRNGTREGDPFDVMERIAKAMSDEEIAAVAAYYASRNPAEVEE